MPHSDRAALAAFFADLNRAWKKAGPPSFQGFETLSKRVEGPGTARGPWLSRSTTQDILAMNRRYPPKWQWVARFITVLRVAAAEAGVNPDSLGSLAEWKQKHELVSEALAAAPQLAKAAGGGRRAATLDAAASPADGRARDRRRAAGLLLDGRYARHDPALARLLRKVGQDWWHEYRDLVPDWQGAYLSLEPAAKLIRVYDTMLVPALLQTEKYADAAIRLAAGCHHQPADKRLIELRMRRQQILIQPDAPTLWAIIEETAVRHRLGSANTMREQLKHLINIAQQPNVSIQVIPLDTSVHAIAGGPITLLRFPPAKLPDVVYLEQLTGAHYLPRQGEVSHYHKVLSGLGVEALKPEATVDFLRDILMEL